MLHVYLLLDISASMNGAPFEAMKQGAALVRTTFASRGTQAISLAVMTYHSTAEMIHPLTDVHQPFVLPPLMAGGTSRLGAAFRLLRSQLHAGTPTLVYIFTDGEPNDDWGQPLAAVRGSVKRIFGLACRMDTDRSLLSPFCDQVYAVQDVTPDTLFGTFRTLVV